MDAREAFRRLLRVPVSFTPDGRRALAEAYAAYLESIPPEGREATVVILTRDAAVAVKRSEIPRLIVEDERFYELFAAYLRDLALAWEVIKSG